MRIRELLISIGLFLLLTILLFYKSFLHGQIAFPGDLLISEYTPWKTMSFLGYAIGGFPSKGQYFDVIRQMYPWRHFAISLWQQGQVPLWNPYNFSGTPLLANFQSAALYPFNIIFAFFPFIFAWNVLVIVQIFFAGWFSYLFARLIKISRIGSAMAGLAFCLSSFSLVWVEYNTVLHVILWMPLALFAIENIIITKKIRWILLLIFSLVASLTAGHPQIFFYVFIFCFLYAGHRINTYYPKYKKIKYIFFMLLFFLFVAGIGSIQLLPGIELIQQAARASHTYETLITKLLIQPQQLIMLFIPDFFGNPATRNYWIQDTYVGKMISIGIIPLFFVLLSLREWKNLLIRFFIGASVLVLVIATNNPLTHLLFRLPLGFLTSSGPTLVMFLFCFSMSILSGFGVDIFQKKHFSLKQFLLWITPLIIVFTAIGILSGVGSHIGFFPDSNAQKIALRNTLIPLVIVITAIILLYISQLRKKASVYLLIVLLIIQFFDGFKGFQKFNPFVPSSIVYPSTSLTTFIKTHGGIDRFWGIGSANIESNLATQYEIYSPEGYDPLYPRWYGELISASGDGHILAHFSDQNRSDAKIAQTDAQGFLTNAYRQKILNTLGVKYIISTSVLPLPYKQVFSDGYWLVYQNPNVLPRFFLSNSYNTYKTTEEFTNKFFQQTNPKTILMENNTLPSLTAQHMHVQLSLYAPNHVAFTTNTDGKAILFTSDTFYPGWHAYVSLPDKMEPLPIYKADYAFRSVVVPEGRHTIIFLYEPRSFALGVKISIISSVLLLGLLIGIKKFRWL